MIRKLAFNPDECLACRSCELACAVIHSASGTLETAILEAPAPRRRVMLSGGGPYGALRALRCEQCDEPLCVFSCKSGALHRDLDSGHVILDDDACVGCWMCIMVCPYGVRPDADSTAVVRCDVCREHEQPACVKACPTSALKVAEKMVSRPTSGFSGHVVIIGSSAAGIGACEGVRRAAPGALMTMVTLDEDPQYSRPMLAYMLAEKIQRARVVWKPEGYLTERLGVHVLSGVSAVTLDAKKKSLRLSNGTELSYDRLIIATGARGELPDIPGIHLKGVFTLRGIDDVDGIARNSGPGRRAVVLGGGNIGLQACEALLKLGTHVTVVVRSPHLLSQMVDEEAGRRVGELFSKNGLVIRTGRDVASIKGEDHVTGVQLDNGDRIDADFVVVGKGIRPNVEWLRDGGVTIGRGVVVDFSGHTNVDGIFAAGDCAEMSDPISERFSVSGIWPIAYETGYAAGSTAAGVERVTRGALRMNSSTFFKVPLVSIGEVRQERIAGAHTRILAQSSDVYRTLVMRGRRIAGALLYGDIHGAGILYRLYRDAIEIDEVTIATVTDREIVRVLNPFVARQEGE